MTADASNTQPLRLAAVHIALPGRVLIDALSFTVEAGRIVTVMGPSGSGKSALLSWIGGFLGAPFEARGDVTLGARSLIGVPPHARRVGILFQDDLLFPHLSVAGNLLFGVAAAPPTTRAPFTVGAHSTKPVPASVARSCDFVGGQRARVALFRTLLAQPQAAARRAVGSSMPLCARTSAASSRLRAPRRPADGAGDARCRRCRSDGRRSHRTRLMIRRGADARRALTWPDLPTAASATLNESSSNPFNRVRCHRFKLRIRPL